MTDLFITFSDFFGTIAALGFLALFVLLFAAFFGWPLLFILLCLAACLILYLIFKNDSSPAPYQQKNIVGSFSPAAQREATRSAVVDDSGKIIFHTALTIENLTIRVVPQPNAGDEISSKKNPLL